MTVVNKQKSIMLVIIDKSSRWYGHSAVVKSMVNNHYLVDVLEVNNNILTQELFKPDEVITALEYRKLQTSMGNGCLSGPYETKLSKA